MGVVSKLTELSKVALTLNAAPAKATATKAAPSVPAGGTGLTAEQLLNELKKAQRSAA